MAVPAKGTPSTSSLELLGWLVRRTKGLCWLSVLECICCAALGFRVVLGVGFRVGVSFLQKKHRTSHKPMPR